jgi:hypothetical protein
MAMICQQCGGKMVASTLHPAGSSLPWLLILAGLVIGVLLGIIASVVLGVVVGLPMVLGGFLLLSRSSQNVWRCTACTHYVERP